MRAGVVYEFNSLWKLASRKQYKVPYVHVACRCILQLALIPRLLVLDPILVVQSSCPVNPEVLLSKASVASFMLGIDICPHHVHFSEDDSARARFPSARQKIIATRWQHRTDNELRKSGKFMINVTFLPIASSIQAALIPSTRPIREKTQNLGQKPER